MAHCSPMVLLQLCLLLCVVMSFITGFVQGLHGNSSSSCTHRNGCGNSEANEKISLSTSNGSPLDLKLTCPYVLNNKRKDKANLNKGIKISERRMPQQFQLMTPLVLQSSTISQRSD